MVSKYQSMIIDDMIEHELKIIMITNSKIFIAGHNGMLGSSIFRKLRNKGYNNIIVVNKKS